MRRVVWLVLTGLGVFLIVVALAAEFFVPGQAVKFPLNEYNKSTLIAKDASYFSQKKVTEESGVTLQATNTTLGNVADANTIGSSSTAVWESYTAVEDVTNHTAVEIPAEGNTFAFNRRTGALVPWSGDSVDGKHVAVSGQGSVWPFGSQKQSYQVYDTTLGKPVTFSYTGTTTVQGVSTYVYSANVPSQQVGTQTLPGSLVGLTAPVVTLPEFYSVHETYDVDPVTGDPLFVTQHVQQVLKTTSGATALVLINANFVLAPSSVTAGVNTDNSARSEISLLTVIIPLIAGILGVLLVVLGIIFTGSRPEDEEYADEDEPVGAAA
jgi:Porin PorA